MFIGYFLCLKCDEYFKIITSSNSKELGYDIEHVVCPKCGDDWISYPNTEQINELDK